VFCVIALHVSWFLDPSFTHGYLPHLAFSDSFTKYQKGSPRVLLNVEVNCNQGIFQLLSTIFTTDMGICEGEEDILKRPKK